MMASVEEKIKTGGGMIVGGQTLAAEMKLLKEMHEHSGLLFRFPFLFFFCFGQSFFLSFALLFNLINFCLK